MMTELGMDPEQVLAIATKLDRAAQQVTAAQATVSQVVSQTGAAWKGPDLASFTAQWGTHRNDLSLVSASIRELATKARTNAQAQITTSNQYDGGVGLGGGPFGGLPWGPFGGAGTTDDTLFTIPGIFADDPVGAGPGGKDLIPGLHLPFHIGYDYTYHETIGSVSDTGGAQHAALVFEQNLSKIFPFTVTPAGPVHDGDILTLHPGPGIVGGTGQVQVHTTPTGVTFTVVSDHYFDNKGSQISFNFTEQNGQVVLTQHGDPEASNLFGLGGVDAGVAKLTWDQQASNLRDVLGVPQPFDPTSPYDYYNQYDHHSPLDVKLPYLPTPVPLGPPLPDHLTPTIDTPQVDLPGGVDIPGVHIPGVPTPHVHVHVPDPQIAHVGVGGVQIPVPIP